MAEATPSQQTLEVASSIVATGTADPAFPFPLPRVTIRFCTQCKWMLRAAYVSPCRRILRLRGVACDRILDRGQLLFSAMIAGEDAILPGLFYIPIYHMVLPTSGLYTS